jgi:hypothetical protein
MKSATCAEVHMNTVDQGTEAIASSPGGLQNDSIGRWKLGEFAIVPKVLFSGTDATMTSVADSWN